MAVDDRLRQPGRARAVEHPERVVERHLLEGELSLLPAGARGRPSGSLAEAGERRLRVEVAEQHRVRDRRQRGEQLLHDGEPVEVLASVAVAVHGQEHLRLDLREAVDHAAGAEVRRARDQIAPIDAHASCAAIASGMFGRYATTRSPGADAEAP